VLEESMVLGGEDGVEEDQRHVGQPHRPVLLARAIVGAGQDLGLERGGADVVATAAHARDPLVAHVEPHELRARAVGAAQVDLPHAAGAAVLAGRGRCGFGLAVLEPGQRAGQVDATHAEPGDQRLRRGVHERAPPRFHPSEACQRHRRVRDQSGDEQGEEGQDRQPDQAQTAARNPHDGAHYARGEGPAPQRRHFIETAANFRDRARGGRRKPPSSQGFIGAPGLQP
jgi:hypothetical protein